MTGQERSTLDGSTVPLAAGSDGDGVDGCAETVRRAAELLGAAPGVTYLSVSPASGSRPIPRVHVLVDGPAYVRDLAGLAAGPGPVPAFYDHDTDPSWAGRVNGVWLHVSVDFDAGGA